MRHGICILPEHPWREAEPLWRRAEELAFDHAWTYDHLVWAGLPDSPWHSTVATLTAAAMVTDRIALGTLVASPNFRHPVTLARDVVTLDDISGGRILLGVGAGGDLDAGVLGQQLTRGQRSARFREFVPLLDRLLREHHVSHEGEFYAAVEARNLTPVRTPLVVAAQGPRAMELAVRYAAGWVTAGSPSGPWVQRHDVDQWWRSVAEQAERFSEVESSVPERAGATGALDRYLTLDAAGPTVLSSVESLTEQVGRAEELGFTDVIVHWPRTDGPYAADLAVLEDYLADVP